ncbi:hypothetical protein KZX29_04150 [Moraxella osloensis]|uniref:hypothetical protein n=1 Tax=Faucicola osloensis TaxID=34062 RepID=UPI002003C3C0|nr:hypothetical protein [Moraxella osloensis]MCK6157988.1 hypothetical protein [Moraxella osloensis]
MRKQDPHSLSAPKPIYPIHRRLTMVWWVWLGFRLLAVPILTHWLASAKPAMVGGIAWQALWLIPALLSTPYIVKGKSPYALLLLSMLTFVYLGGSGMVALKYGYQTHWGLMAVWLVDFVLLGWVNYWLFILLRRLPKMNG